MTPRSSPRSALDAGLALALLLGAAGCGTTKVSRVWADSGLKDERYQRVMVLVLAASEARRETAEDRIVAELGRGGVQAIRSWEKLSDADLTSRERLGEAVTSAGVDSLLVVRVKQVDKDVEVHQGRESWVPVATGSDYYGYVSTSYGLYRKQEITELLQVTTETTLWDVATRKMVWACQSDSESANETLTTAELADDYAKAVTKKVEPYFRRK
jgi:hypothetical protein